MKKLLLCLSLCLLMVGASAQNEITILFTHDLHSSLLGSDGKGGYARLLTIINQERAHDPNTLLLDAGDISMGSFFHTLFDIESTELRLMGRMGYDAITFGNHDFDFGLDALIKALNIAKQHGSIPLVLASNIKFKNNPEYALEAYNVKEYSVFEKAGKRIGVFGLLGYEPFDNTVAANFLKYEDPIACAQRMVKFLRTEEKADMVICLSHCGTNPRKELSEDEHLAQKVKGLDLVISAHSHTMLSQPIIVGQTAIVSSGSYGNYLGKATFDLRHEKPLMKDYKLIEITDIIPEDDTIKNLVAHFKDEVNRQYLQLYGLHFDDTVTHINFTLHARPNAAGESTLGNLVADAYLHAARQANKKVNISVANWGAIRCDLKEGYVKEETVFNILSLGRGADGKAGHPLVLLYLKGKEIEDLCELDASIASNLSYASLFFSGIRYEYNPNRLFCNKVTKVQVVDDNGNFTEPDPEKLYAVVASLYAAQLLEVVRGKTFGILSIEPKTADGMRAVDFEAEIIKDASGNEVKGWLTLDRYLRELKEIPAYYAATHNQKVRDESRSLKALFAHSNGFAWIVYAIATGLAASVVLLIIFIVRKIRKKKRS